MEYKSAGLLPKHLPSDCAKCEGTENQDRFNCGGEGNENFEVGLGTMEFYQCPKSLPTQQAWDVIELILTQEETGIPIIGTCLMQQTRAMFTNRRIILSERGDCMKEISDKQRKAQDAKDRQSNRSGGGAFKPRSRPTRIRQ